MRSYSCMYTSTTEGNASTRRNRPACTLRVYPRSLLLGLSSTGHDELALSRLSASPSDMQPAEVLVYWCRVGESGAARQRYDDGTGSRVEGVGAMGRLSLHLQEPRSSIGRSESNIFFKF